MAEYICNEVQTDNGGYLEIKKELVRCKDCKYWQTDDGTFPDFDGRPWHECKCLYMFRAPDGEPARTTADFWCGYGERRKGNETGS